MSVAAPAPARIHRNTLIKMTGPERMPAHGGHDQWPPAGEWREQRGKIVQNVNGLHLTTARFAGVWAAAEMWRAEIDPQATTVRHGSKIVTARARLLDRVETWNHAMLRHLAVDMVAHALPLFRLGSDAVSIALNAIRSSERPLGECAFERDLEYFHEGLRQLRRAHALHLTDALVTATYGEPRNILFNTASDVRAAVMNLQRGRPVEEQMSAFHTEERWQVARLLQYLNGELDPVERRALAQAGQAVPL